MVWTDGIKGKIVENGMNYEMVAKRLGISVNALGQKIRGVKDFKATEMDVLCQLLGIENEITRYFFSR